MYRLKRYKATNLIGFASGIGKKTVEIDLSDYLEKDVVVIVGQNASGKSTFMSTIHPWPWPTDKRKRFIIEGKEGSVIREFIGDDGTEILTRCIYKPKKTNGEWDGHSCQAYFQVTPHGGEAQELNANGNVTSFNQLVYTYFGITKDFLNFASYNDAVSSIVGMNDTERKDCVDMLIPNVKRFEVAYDIVNDKYKELRNMIRNLSQKILTLRDEDSLEADLKRLTKEIIKYSEERESEMKKMARIKGRLDEISGGKDLDQLVDRYNLMVSNLAVYDTQIAQVQRKLLTMYQELGIEPEKPGSVVFADMDKVPAYILRYEKKLASLDADMTNYIARKAKIQPELDSIDKELAETESMLFSIEMQDPKKLEETKASYERQLAGLRYSRRIEEFEDMTYDEAVNMSRQVVIISQMIDALYGEYGELVSQLFSGPLDFGAIDAEAERARIDTQIQKTSMLRDQAVQQLIECRQYEKFTEILKLRPAECQIDNCPFIAESLGYANMTAAIPDLANRCKSYDEQILQLNQERDNLYQRIALQSDAQKLVQYLAAIEPLLIKYLKVPDLNTLYRAVGSGSWGKYLDIQSLKELAAILSEKELYLQIVNIQLPEINHMIEMAKAHGTNRELLEHQRDQLQRQRSLYVDELEELRMHVGIGEKQRGRYERNLNRWNEIEKGLNSYKELIQNQIDTQAEVKGQDDKIKMIRELVSEAKAKKGVIAELDALIRERQPLREKTNLDLDALRRLNIEKAEIERNFIIIDIIRRMVSPGKGIRKELLSIYMDEIRETANQLLLNTFDGKLYLEEFVITDKEFVIPYMYNGAYGSDISFASSAQKAMISFAMSMAILSRLMTKYSILSADELDGPLSSKNKNEFIPIMIRQMKYIGINTVFMITQSPDKYEPYSPLFITFPGAEINRKGADVIDVTE